MGQIIREKGLTQTESDKRDLAKLEIIQIRLLNDPLGMFQDQLIELLKGNKYKG